MQLAITGHETPDEYCTGSVQSADWGGEGVNNSPLPRSAILTSSNGVSHSRKRPYTSGKERRPLATTDMHAFIIEVFHFDPGLEQT